MTEHTAITGNASTAVKDAVRGVLPKTWRRGGAGFGDAIGARLVITEVHILHADGARPRKTARVIVECTVQEGNVNGVLGVRRLLTSNMTRHAQHHRHHARRLRCVPHWLVRVHFVPLMNL
jgi:hypothetical protein